MRIFVHWSEAETSTIVEINVADSIAVVKERISKKTGIPVGQQQLKFGSIVLDDSKTVVGQGIRHEGTLILSAPFNENATSKWQHNVGAKRLKVSITTTTGDVLHLKVSPLDTIAKVKEKIEDKQGVVWPADQKRLTFDGEILDDCKCLKEYHIQNGATLHYSILHRE